MQALRRLPHWPQPLLLAGRNQRWQGTHSMAPGAWALLCVGGQLTQGRLLLLLLLLLA